MMHPASLAYSAFRRLPRFARRLVVRGVSPSYTVGVVAVVRDGTDRLLLLRERHHDGWGLPGGLLARGEAPGAALVREVAEEIAVTLDPAALERPLVNVDPYARRVDIVFTVDGAGLTPRACEPEVLEARWFGLDELPELFAPTVGVLRAAGVADLDAAG